MLLREARKKARYSQAQVASLMGVSRPTYAKMEKYPEDISISDGKNLAELFEVAFEDIFFGQDYKQTYSLASAES